MSKEKRITIVIRSLERGGTETHLLRTMPAVASKEFDIEVFCFERPGELSLQMKQCGIDVVTPPISGWFKHIPLVFKPFTTIWTCIYFLWHLFVRNPDVIHFFLPAAYLLLAPISLLHTRSKKVMSRRSLNNYLAKYPIFVRNIELNLHKKMSAILANSKAVAVQLKESEGVGAGKIHLIYNGIGEGELENRALTSARNFLGISRNSTVLIVVANLLPYKGYRDLIDACSVLSQELGDLPEWDLIIVGNDSVGIKRELEELALAAGIREKLHFVGKITNVQPYLTASDIGLLVSHEEGFSNSIIEGMLVELPMIVSDVGGNPEAVLHGETGLVVAPKAPRDLAKAIAYLLKEPDVAKRMGRAGGQRVRECFSIQKSSEAYQTVYRSLGTVE